MVNIVDPRGHVSRLFRRARRFGVVSPQRSVQVPRPYGPCLGDDDRRPAPRPPHQPLKLVALGTGGPLTLTTIHNIPGKGRDEDD